MRPVLLLLLSIGVSAAPAMSQACWRDAARAWGVSADLLYAIAKVESNLSPRAVNRSHLQRTGSYDIGLMQINSAHLPRLARHGIQEADLFDACTNLQVGAWILAHNFAKWGNSWEAVGAYNASCTRLQGTACRKARSAYAWRVYQHLPRSPDASASRLPQPLAAVSASNVDATHPIAQAMQ